MLQTTLRALYYQYIFFYTFGFSKSRSKTAAKNCIKTHAPDYPQGVILSIHFILHFTLSKSRPKTAAKTSLKIPLICLLVNTCAFRVKLWYNVCAVDSLQQRGGVQMDYLISFLISVGASIAAYYICKWLDGED